MLKKIFFVFEKKELQKEADKIKEQLGEYHIEYMILNKKEMEKGALVICDSEKVCNWCVENKVAVIVFLQENNRSCDFSKVKYAVEGFEGIDSTYLNKVYQRCHGKPWKILETRRCIVREMTEDDMEGLYRIYENSSITMFLDGLYKESEKEKEYIKNYIEYIYRFYEYGMWVVEEKGSSQLIGRAGVEWKEGVEGLELGYIIAEPYQRKGIAYEVCSAIIAYVRDYITSQPIYIQTHAKNEASIRVAEKLGFVFDREVENRDKILKQYILRN